MRITVLNVTIATMPTKTGKTYQVADVAYKNNTFQDKVEGKKVMSFGVTADTFKVLATAQPGQAFEVNVVKNDKGYNDWVSMQPAGEAVQQYVPPQTSAASSGYASKPATTAGRSNYETPEERAQRQVFIIRQSSAATAERLHSAGAKAPAKVDDVIATARKLESYVLGQDKGPTGFDDLPDFPGDFADNPTVD